MIFCLDEHSSCLLHSPSLNVVPPTVSLQAAPCWPLTVCQASSSCRSWRNWSWPTALEPPPSSSNTTPSTCPTAWSSSKTTDPSYWSTDRPIAILLPSSSLLFLTVFSNASQETELLLLYDNVPHHLLTRPSSSTPHWVDWPTGGQRGRKADDGRCQTQKMTGWRLSII